LLLLTLTVFGAMTAAQICQIQALMGLTQMLVMPLIISVYLVRHAVFRQLSLPPGASALPVPAVAE
jgi:hypothetical protein